MTEKKDEEKKGIVESFLGEIPILGNLVKELGKTETFKKKFAETDEKIKENLRKGETLRNRKTISGALKTQGVLNEKKWSFEANISARPIINVHKNQRFLGHRKSEGFSREIKKESTELTIEDDYFYRKKGNKLTLAVKVPKEEVDLEIKYKTLRITSDNFEKNIKLPAYYRKIKKKKNEEGILVLELTK